MRLFLVVFVMFLGLHLKAQIVKDYSVRVGEKPNEVLPNEALYELPVFKQGTIFLRDGTSSIKKINYNFFLNEMHFIGDNNDTLAMAEPVLIKRIVIDSMVFYFDKGFLKEIFNSGKYKLMVREHLMQIGDRTRGAYDMPTASSSIRTYGTINNGQTLQLQVKKDVIFRKEISYYIGDSFDLFLKATKKNFQLLFEQKDIFQFVKANHINLNKEKDLKFLLQFCVE